MASSIRFGARDPNEPYRGATPLELFFDLTFVVAISEAATSLHHGLVDGHAAASLIAFAAVFFAIWWAWMNFTWYSSAYDNDDPITRVAVLVQMMGVLILAAGVPRVFESRDFVVVAEGYVVMRFALVAMWLRAAHANPDGRTCARRYAIGITLVQIAWILQLTLPRHDWAFVLVVLAAAELGIPLWAESAGRTPWHPRHIAERYGLFTIIVLGESILAATVGVQVAVDADTRVHRLATVVVGGLVLVFMMWWTYFDMPTTRVIEQVRRDFASRLTSVFAWGYGHYVVFASAAAVGVGLNVNIDQVTHHSKLTDLQAHFAITIPVAVYLVSVWALHVRAKPKGWLRDVGVPVTTVLVLASTFTPEPVLISGLLLAALVAINVFTSEESRAAAD